MITRIEEAFEHVNQRNELRRVSALPLLHVEQEVRDLIRQDRHNTGDLLWRQFSDQVGIGSSVKYWRANVYGAVIRIGFREGPSSMAIRIFITKSLGGSEHYSNVCAPNSLVSLNKIIRG